MDKMKMINPTELKVGMYVLCIQKNKNHFIGKISELNLSTDHIRFEFTLLDNGVQTSSASGNISDFEFVDVSGLCAIIDLIRMIPDSKFNVSSINANGCTSKDDSKSTIDFNEEQWLAHKYPLVTRDGLQVRIVDTTVKGKYHILALLKENEREEMPVCYDSNGHAGVGNDPNSPRFKDLDLLMVVEKPKAEIKPETKYAYVYKRDNTGTTFMSQLMNSVDELKNINTPAGCSIVATIPVTY